MRRLVRWVLMSMIFVCASIGVLAVIMLLTTTPEERASYSVTRTADAIAGNATGTAEAPTITRTPSATMTATITDTATIAPSDTPDLSSEVTMSEATTSTDNPFEGAFDNVPGIEIVVAQRASQYEEGGWFVYGEFIVAEDAQNTGTADALLTAAMAVDAPLSSVAFVLDDRETATDYSADAGDDEWTTAVRKFNLPSDSIDDVQPQLIATESLMIVATAAPVDTQIPRPGNCPTAVAMGLDAQTAAQWAHLDRDNDGVACYGD